MVLCWENNLTNFNLLDDENLKMPAETLQALVNRYARQAKGYAEYIPNFFELGMIKVNLMELKKTIIPNPKKCQQKIKD